MSIAVIGGTGEEGFGLVLRLAHMGERVVIGSRSEERGRAAADRARELMGPREVVVEGTTNEEAAKGSRVVFVTVPFAGQAEIYRSIATSIRPDALVCDTTTPLATAVGGRPWQVVTPWAGSAAEQAKAILPRSVRLVGGFHTVSSEQLRAVDEPMEGHVLLCGADGEAKAEIGALVERIPNLQWVDAGPLSMARIVEPLTALLISVNRNYGIKHSGVALTGRASWGLPPAAKGSKRAER
jgi:8-hydroxy-5-deazaflavin:NADPH oxidoreductase